MVSNNNSRDTRIQEEAIKLAKTFGYLATWEVPSQHLLLDVGRFVKEVYLIKCEGKTVSNQTFSIAVFKEHETFFGLVNEVLYILPHPLFAGVFTDLIENYLLPFIIEPEQGWYKTIAYFEKELNALKNLSKQSAFLVNPYKLTHPELVRFWETCSTCTLAKLIPTDVEVKILK